MSTDVTKSFADILGQLVSESGKPLKELAKEIGVSYGSISKYQNDNAAANIDALCKFADYFKVSTDYLLGRTEIKKPSVEIQAICDYTGLNETAIENLHAESKDAETPKALNAILGCPIYDDFHRFWWKVYAALNYSAAVQGKTIFKPEDHMTIKFNGREISSFTPPQTVNYLSIDAAQRLQNIMYWSTATGEGLHPWFAGSLETDKTP